MDASTIDALVLAAQQQDPQGVSKDTIAALSALDAVLVAQGCLTFAAASTDAAAVTATLGLAREVLVHRQHLQHQPQFRRTAAAAPPDPLRDLQDALLAYVLRTDVPLPLRVEAVSSVTALAVQTVSKGWPKLWLSASTVLNDPNSDPSQCHVFGVFVQQATELLAGSPLRANLATLLSGFGVSIQRCEYEEMVLECVAGLAHLMMKSHADHGTIIQSTAVASMLGAAAKGSGRVAEAIFGALGNALVFFPKLAVKHTAAIQRTVLLVMRSDHLDVEAKLSASQPVGALFHVLDTKAAARQVGFITEYVQALLDLMLSTAPIQVDDAWMNSYDSDGADGRSHGTGSAILKHLNNVLEGAVIGPMLLAFVDKYVHAPQWQERYVALLALTSTFRGHRKECVKRVDGLLKDVLVPRLVDDHPAVRYNALRCFAQLVTDLAPTPGAKLKVASTLSSVNARAASDPIGRVRAIAVSTLKDFFENIKIDTFEPLAFESAKAVATCALTAEADDLRLLCLVALSALTRLAARCEPHELQALLWPLFTMLFGQWSALTPIVRCHTLEASSQLAAAVGVDVLGYDNGAVICERLLQMQPEDNHIMSDEMLPYAMRSWSLVTDCLGAGVTPFLDQAMPFILTVACPSASERIHPSCDAAEQSERTDGIDGLAPVASFNSRSNAAIALRHLVVDHGRLLRRHFDSIEATCVELLKHNADNTSVANAAAMLAFIGDTYAGEADSDSLARFVSAVRAPLVACTSRDVTEKEMVMALTTLIRAAPLEAIDDELLDAVSRAINFVVGLALITNTGSPSTSSDDDDLVGPNGEQLTRVVCFGERQFEGFENAMRLCAVAVSKHSDFCNAFFEATVLPDAGKLLAAKLTWSHHWCGLRVLECYVDAVPHRATTNLSSIAEAAAYYAREAKELKVLDVAFRLSGKIVPLVAAVAGSATAEAAVLYGSTILSAVLEFWQQHKFSWYVNSASQMAALSSVECAIRVVDAFPAAAEGKSLNELMGFLTYPRDSTEQLPPEAKASRTFVFASLRKWLAEPSTSGVRFLSVTPDSLAALVADEPTD